MKSWIMPPKSTLKASRLVWLMLLSTALVVGVAALRFRGWQAAAKSQKVKIESAVTLQAKGRGGAEINFANGATIPTEYSGDAEFSQARPLTLAAGDFDGDGVEDLMSGYATPNGGLLTLHRGNVESIFPGPSETQPAPFFPEARTFVALEQPDFLVVGDFNNDGRQDAVTARRGGDGLSFFQGDGNGHLQSAEGISVEGKVTALIAGELNRKDGLRDLAVGISSADGAKVLILEGWNGALSEPPALVGGSAESFVLPHAVTAFAVVSLAENGFGDLAIAAGNKLLVLHGRDRQLTLNKESRGETEATISHHTFEAEIVALTTGRFTDGTTNEIAVLTKNGSLHAAKEAKKGKKGERPILSTRIFSSSDYLPASPSQLLAARVSANSATDDLILLDEANRTMRVLKKEPEFEALVSGENARQGTTPSEGGTLNSLSVAATFDGEPIAAVPMRLNKDGLDDIVFLSESPASAGGSENSRSATAGFPPANAGGSHLSHLAPSVALTAPQAIFTVNSTGNGGDSNTADGVCNNGSGFCTLRAAIQQANASPGADEVRFNIPGAPPFTFAPDPLGMSEPVETITIDGTTQPGFTNAPIIEIDGSNAQGLRNGINFTRTFTAPIKLSSDSVLRGIVLNRHKEAGVRSNDQNISGIRIEGCYIGTDVTGTIARPNGTSGGATAAGVLISGNTHRIGGTVTRAKNVISANNGHGIHLPGSFTTLAVLVAGNFIGTDVTGTVDLGNSGDGIRSTFAGFTLGETFAQVRNVISGNAGNGVNAVNGGVTVQNNLIGTSADGNTDLGNDKTGLRMVGNGGNRIGGTAANTRNIISGNGLDGIELNISDTMNIQGNFIGTRADGTTLMINDRHSIFLTNFTSGTLVGGDTVTPGTCDGPCNVLAFGANGRAVSITNANPSNLTEQNDGAKLQHSSATGPSPTGNANAIKALKFFLGGLQDLVVDLGDDGVTPNDLGDGDKEKPNNGKNSPNVEQATPQDNKLNVQGTLNTNPNSINELRIFLSKFDGSATFIGSETVTTNSNGDASFEKSFPVQAQTGDRIFALTTDTATGDTSENSPLISIVPQVCTYAVIPRSFDLQLPIADGRSVEVETQAGCAWQARSNDAFIDNVSPLSGVGPGRVTFNVRPNNMGPTATQTGSLTVAGLIVNVKQPGCTFTVSPISIPVNADSGFRFVNITANFSQCVWRATTGSDFIQVVDAVGSGDGRTRLNYFANNGPNTRPGMVTVAGQTVTVTQTGCGYTVSPTSFTTSAAFSKRAGKMETTFSFCRWDAPPSNPVIDAIPNFGNGDSDLTLFVDSNHRDTPLKGKITFTGGGSISVTVLTKNQTLDFDGDNKADIAKVGTGNNLSNARQGEDGLLQQFIPFATAGVNWVISNSTTGNESTVPFGDVTDKPVPGDYNGDSTSDLAVWRPSNGTWLIAKPTGIPAQNFDSVQFGVATDIPVQADYDGDKRTDIAVFRPSEGDWRILQSSDNQVRVVHLASSTDRLVPADYDGDGKVDIAFWRPSDQTWHILQSSNDSARVVQFGLSDDRPAPGDYDGDFKTDIAVFRPSDGTWRILRSSDNSLLEVKLGLADDVLVPADYDGDLKTDVAVWRPSDGTWRILRSSDGVTKIQQFGQRGDVPIPSASFPQPMFQAVVLNTGQAEIKTWTIGGRTFAYVKLAFSNAGFRVADFGSSARSGNDFSADALVERFNGASVQAVTTTAQIYDLGPLADGNYTFAFKNSGTVVKSQAFTVSSAPPAPNPIDNVREFVKQLYRDFLNREADQAGEDFWTDNITKCNDPARRPPGQTVEQCTLRQRETTSGAFFLSPEFQYTGYYVYRMYVGALGRPPKLSEFIPDTQFVGNGIVVNGQLSAAKINQNKADFAAQFQNCTDPTKYRCAEFKAIYDGLNNTQYVDKLFEMTGVNASANDRADLVNSIGASQTRATVLQKIMDGINVIAEGNQQFTTTYGQAFYDQQFTQAFVQLEYFGYMKRDPDEAGYNFWLAKLNQFGGSFVNAEMVLAFISSPEYRARFGHP